MNTKNGGKWLAAARSWVQHHCLNGSTVQWNTNVELQPPITAAGVESLAECVAKAAVEEETAEIMALLNDGCALLVDSRAAHPEDTDSWEFQKLRWLHRYHDIGVHTEPSAHSDMEQKLCELKEEVAKVQFCNSVVSALFDALERNRELLRVKIYEGYPKKQNDALARVRELESLIKAFRDDPDEARIATLRALFRAVETPN